MQVRECPTKLKRKFLPQERKIQKRPGSAAFEAL